MSGHGRQDRSQSPRRATCASLRTTTSARARDARQAVSARCHVGGVTPAVCSRRRAGRGACGVRGPSVSRLPEIGTHGLKGGPALSPMTTLCERTGSTNAPLQWFVAALCGWILHEQDDVIAFLRKENRVLRAHLRVRRLRLSDEERRRLTVLGHQLGRAALAQVDHRHGRHNSPLAAGADSTQMCAPTAAKRPSSCRGSCSVIDQAYGHRERNVALYPNPGRPKEPRPLCEPVDDCSAPQGTGVPPRGRRPIALRTFIGAHWPALLASDLFTSLAGTFRGLVIHCMALLPELQTRRTGRTPRLGFRTTAFSSGDGGEVHGALAIMRPDSRSAVDVARWGEPAARTSGCPRGPDSRPHTEQPWLYGTVRLVDAAEGPKPRRVTSAMQTPGGTRGIGDAVPWRARSPTAPERVDRISAHAAFVSLGCTVVSVSGDHQLVRRIALARPSCWDITGHRLVRRAGTRAHTWSCETFPAPAIAKEQEIR